MIEVRLDDLTAVEVDCILRPVSTDFSPVTPAMRRLDQAAGSAVEDQCARLGEMPLGSAVITGAGELLADFLVHIAVRSPEENATAATVRRGLLNGLRRLTEWEIDVVAVAPLGTGAGNLDAEEAAEAMLPVLTDHLRSAPHPRRVILVVEDEYQQAAFGAAVERHAGEARTGS